MKNSILLIIGLMGFLASSCQRQNKYDSDVKNPEILGRAGLSKTVVIVWSSADKEVASQLTLSYPLNAKINGWVESMKVFIWGPSVRILAEDQDLQDLVKALISSGVDVQAEKSCAEDYGVSEKLESLGIKTGNLGKSLTSYLAEGASILTF